MFKKWRIIIYKPAVTRVDLWTSALTGVGAIIAKGSQALKGIWALLVHPANKINTLKKINSNLNLFILILNLPKLKSNLNKIIKKRSPTRFLKTVVIAQLADNLLL